MLLKTPIDRAVASIRLVVTELLQTNRVLTAHELISLLHHQLNDVDITATTTNSDNEDSPKRPITSLYPSWYRRGTPSPDHRRHSPLDGRQHDGDQMCQYDLCEPGRDCRGCPLVQLTQQQQHEDEEDGILSRRLWDAVYALDSAGLEQAAYGCVNFGIRHGLREAMLGAVVIREEGSAGFRADGAHAACG